jgi:formylglycine-generating enzyme required for sulfatase activity
VIRGSDRVFRGGSWTHIGEHCRSACRNAYEQARRYNDLGFRVALVLSGE